MPSAASTFLWACVIAESIASPVGLPEISKEAFIDECVREHNRARSSVVPAASDMLYMTWDEDLAVSALEWARKCTVEPNPDLKRTGRVSPTFSSVGENICAGYPATLFNATQFIQSWVEEKRHYNYKSNTCSDVCSNYTQVVWAQTSKVGCAAHSCPNGVQATTFADQAGAVLVCNYASAGNVNGGQPYRSDGKPCSGCEGACLEKLCRPEVDTNWESLQNPTGFSYGTVLLIRPLGLVATLATAYGIHQFYPNIFCYE